MICPWVDDRCFGLRNISFFIHSLSTCTAYEMFPLEQGLAAHKTTAVDKDFHRPLPALSRTRAGESRSGVPARSGCPNEMRLHALIIS